MAHKKFSHKTARAKTSAIKRTPALTDIPRAIKRTYNTHSVVFPSASDRAIIHSTATAIVTAQPTVVTAPAYYFNLAASNASAGSYDQYRMLAVRVSIAPLNNAIGLATNSSTTIVPLYCVIDYDDAVALTTAAQAEGYNNCITLASGESLSRTFKPRMALAAYAGAFTSYANVAPMWIDAVSTGVQHYGIKLLIPAVTTAQTLLPAWLVTFEYAWELRNNLS